ncbi:addiction module toxin RelE [Candidatus Woesearchaeota archaeon]|nr:addiction module toxin RelE [Candidatus Woesearchaeota archaeon]
MYELDIKPEADRIFSKLAKRNPKQLQMIDKKIKEIRTRPAGYKFLHPPLQMFNRVHIDRSFVLIFQIDHAQEVVEIFYFDHHDKVYQWQPEG